MAPETWITAAPQDTITTKDAQGRTTPPVEGRIPIRYHLYWAGSDQDGTVTGFYWAVTETLATPPAAGEPIPGLPNPKPSDYHFTRRTDSTFVFDVSPDAAEREHEFFIAAVDDKGKVDPTPARFVFRAYDRYPPIPHFTLAQAVGSVYLLLPGGGLTRQTGVYPIWDVASVGHPIPADTVPTGSLLNFAWYGAPVLANNPVAGYRYKLQEPQFNVVDSSVHSVTYNTGVGNDVVAPGIKQFTIEASDVSGGHGDSTRFFMMNFSPDEWFAGPDTLSAYWNTYTDGNGKHYYYKDLTTWTGFQAGPGVPNTLLSSDSANVLPVSRIPRRSFFEIYGNRLWAHGEGDTVNLNSWVIVPSGGYDKDSPYAVKVGVDPDKPNGPVVVPGPPNGSPIGFRQLASTRVFDGSTVSPSETTTYPVFDAASVYFKPAINAYCSMTLTGKAYFYADAEDGDGAVDRRIDNAGGAENIVDYVLRDTIGTGVPPPPPTTAMTQLREKVLYFYVNHAPYWLSADPSFQPKPDTTLVPGTVVAFNLPADDLDPLDYTQPYTPGGPQPVTPPVKILARKVRLHGTTTAGRDTTITLTDQNQLTNIAVVIPAYFAVGPGDVLLDLCDYRATDAENRHWGRCAQTLDIPIQFKSGSPPYSAAGAQPNASQSTQRPGSPLMGGGRHLP